MNNSYKIYNIIFILFSLVLIFASTPATATNTPVNLTEEEKALLAAQPNFRILTEEFPPYNYTEKEKITGISTEIVRGILKKLSHADNIEVMPWVDGYKLAQEKDNVILFSTTRTPFREDLFKWVGPLVPNNTVFFARKDSGISINSLDEAKKVKSIGVYKDDFGELLLEKKGFTNLDTVVDNRENVKKLVGGKIDLWAINELTGKHMASEDGLVDKIESVYTVEKRFMYMAFSKSTSDSIIEKWQAALDEIKSDGTYAQIFSKWIMFSFSEDLKPEIATLTKKEKEWLEKHPGIKAAPDPIWPPVEWFDDNGNYSGITADYVTLMEKKLGISFQIVRLKDWDEILEKAKSREIDVIIAAAATPGRNEYLSFTKPYLNLPSVIIVNDKTGEDIAMENLKGKKISVVSGFTSQEYIENNYPDIILDPVSDTLTGLLKVSFGKRFAMVSNVATASYYTSKEVIPNLRVAGDLP
tara:strand:- start:30 stop:1442 length:1413 start_codon:yes stop_codon:yes gene_type:complete